MVGTEFLFSSLSLQAVSKAKTATAAYVWSLFMFHLNKSRRKISQVFTFHIHFGFMVLRPPRGVLMLVGGSFDEVFVSYDFYHTRKDGDEDDENNQ